MNVSVYINTKLGRACLVFRFIGFVVNKIQAVSATEDYRGKLHGNAVCSS